MYQTGTDSEKERGILIPWFVLPPTGSKENFCPFILVI